MDKNSHLEYFKDHPELEDGWYVSRYYKWLYIKHLKTYGIVMYNIENTMASPTVYYDQTTGRCWASAMDVLKHLNGRNCVQVETYKGVYASGHGHGHLNCLFI